MFMHCLMITCFFNVTILSQINFIIDEYDLYKKPGEFKADQNLNIDHNLWKITFGLGLTAISFAFDDEIRRQSDIDQKSKNNLFLRVGHSYGDFYYNLYLSGGLILTQFITENKEYARTGKALFESILVGSLFSISLKYIFGRSRPYKEEGNFKFNWFEKDNINNSLPSGHVITAFTTSTVLSKWIKNDFASIFLYGLASLTAYQRIITDNHWLSDVLLGASIGYLTAEFFHNQNQIDNCGNKSYYIVPFFSDYSKGISLNYFF